jgi:hypothetical protein
MAILTIAPAPRSTTVIHTGSVTVPANANTATVSFLMPVDAERASTSQHLDYSIDISTNGGTTWKPYLNAGWNGGTGAIAKNSTVVNPPPGSALGGDFFAAFVGASVRVSAKLTEPMTLGLTASSTRL